MKYSDAISDVLTLVKFVWIFSQPNYDTYCFFDVVDDLEVPVPSEENDVVDLELFWEKMEYSLIFRGLIKGV